MAIQQPRNAHRHTWHPRKRHGTERLAMTPGRVTQSVLALALLIHPALAAEAWEGVYDCPQGRTGLTLTLEPADPGVTALFHFYADPSNPGIPEGCFAMSGTLDPGTGRLELRAGQWLLRPDNYYAVDLTGQVSPDRQRLQGEIPSPGCTVFDLSRTVRPIHVPPPPCRPGSPLVS